MNMPLDTPAIPDHYPAIVEAGDSGLMVLFGDTLEMSVNNAVHAFDAMFRSVSLAGVEEITPGIRGLMIRYDPLSISADALRDAINEKLTERNWLESPANPERKVWSLPAHYGDESGPDLDAVVTSLKLPRDEVIRQHSETAVRVLMLGFAPGCAYLGSLPAHWDLPRLDYVKPEVPAGSLSVAVRQTVLFATKIPTGWQTIARTPFRSFEPDRSPYFFLAPGDEVTFTPIDQREYLKLEKEVQAGKQIVSPKAP